MCALHLLQNFTSSSSVCQETNPRSSEILRKNCWICQHSSDACHLTSSRSTTKTRNWNKWRFSKNSLYESIAIISRQKVSKATKSIKRHKLTSDWTTELSSAQGVESRGFWDCCQCVFINRIVLYVVLLFSDRHISLSPVVHCFYSHFYTFEGSV